MFLSDKSAGHQNNFDLIRLLAALAVVCSHSYPLLGIHQEPLFDVTGYDNLGNLSVRIFFLLSGFLITKSWLTNPQLIDYLAKRVLRIYPAAIVCITLTVLVLGVLTTNLPEFRYLSHPQTLSYLQHNLALLSNVEFKLPGVFTEHPYPNVVNGSLWTLPIELKLYLFVAMLGIAKIFPKRALVLTLTVVLSLYLLLSGQTYDPLNKLWLVLYFLVGMLYHLYQEKVILKPFLAFTALICIAISLNTQLYPVACLVCLPYLTFFTGFIPLPQFSKKLTQQDLSYGIYIYAMPVQQCLILYTGNTIHPVLFILLSIGCILPFAFLSWHYVEKPALSLKRLIPKNPWPQPIKLSKTAKASS